MIYDNNLWFTIDSILSWVKGSLSNQTLTTYFCNSGFK